MFRHAAALVMALAAGPAGAASLADFSSFFVFGDSLSDDGERHPGFPPAPYHASQFSDGPVWAVQVAAGFAETENYAFGGSLASGDQTGIPVIGTIPGLGTEIDAFAFDLASAAADPGDRPLASILAGSNDLFGALQAAAADPANGAAILGGAVLAAVAAIGDALDRLDGLGVEDVAVWLLPDLGKTPRLNGNPLTAAAGSAASAAFNGALKAMLATRTGQNIALVDLAGLIEAAVADPASYGLTNVTDPCLPVEPFSLLLGGTVPAACTDPEAHLFWDTLHPSSTGHDQLAALFASSLAGLPDGPVAPVPLPATGLLLAGGVLVLLRRRR